MLKMLYCNVCKETPIFEKKEHKVIVLPEYTEVSLVLSDETVARHGICTHCAPHLTDEKIAKLYEDIRETLLDQMVGTATDAQFDQVRLITVWGWHLGFSEAIQMHHHIKEKKHNAVIAESHNKGHHANR